MLEGWKDAKVISKKLNVKKTRSRSQEKDD